MPWLADSERNFNRDEIQLTDRTVAYNITAGDDGAVLDRFRQSDHVAGIAAVETVKTRSRSHSREHDHSSNGLC